MGDIREESGYSHLLKQIVHLKIYPYSLLQPVRVHPTLLNHPPIVFFTASPILLPITYLLASKRMFYRDSLTSNNTLRSIKELIRLLTSYKRKYLRSNYRGTY